MSQEVVGEFSININRVEGYQFRIDFGDDGPPPLILDEPPPLGQDAGPNPSKTLAAALGSCLAMSLLFCLGKSRIELKDLSAEVKVQSVRNERKRLRLGRIDVLLKPEFAEGDKDRADRCRQLFEDFCVVTQSLRDGVDVDVKVAGFDD